jgi:hypothetical protein
MRGMNWILVLIAVVFAVLLLQPTLLERPFWRATITPLASIIGSGFLIIAPLLGVIAGEQALGAMLLILLLAYSVGGIIRFNIRHAEPPLAVGGRPALAATERFSNVMLSIAYVVSIAFYLRLLASFVLDHFELASPYPAQWLTTAILLFIGIYGWRRGLKSLEHLEAYSVGIKLAIIGALLVGLLAHDLNSGFTSAVSGVEGYSALDQLRMLGGMLLVVQGFETSRYLGSEYTTGMRVWSMRAAQILSTCIYLGFVYLIMPVLPAMHGTLPDETEIIHIAGVVALVLPPMLVIAAVMSQFSASIADTLAAGGLAEEESRGRFPASRAYLLVAALAIAIIWATNVFEIVTLASRAFAAYYFAQAVVAVQTVPAGMHGAIWLKLWFSILAGLLLAIVLFSIPVG